MNNILAHLMKFRIKPASHRPVRSDKPDQQSPPEEALRTLLEKVDAVIVIGEKKSNNARQILSTCRKSGTPSFGIERLEELSPAWFTGFKKVGVSAGTTTTPIAVETRSRVSIKDSKPA